MFHCISCVAGVALVGYGYTYATNPSAFEPLPSEEQEPGSEYAREDLSSVDDDDTNTANNTTINNNTNSRSSTASERMSWGSGGVAGDSLLSPLATSLENNAREGASATAEEPPGHNKPGGEIAPGTSLLAFPPVFVVVLALAACNTSVAITEPLIPLYMSSPPFNYGHLQVGLVFGVQALGYLIFTPVFGYLSDTMLKTPIMIFGLASVASGMAILLLTETLWVIITGLALIGIGVAGCDAPSMPLLTLLVPPSRIGAAMALQDSAVNLGFLVGPLLAITVGSHESYFKWLCLGMAGSCLLVAPSMGVLLRYETNMEQIAAAKKQRTAP